jgi:hypothetical protein
MSLAVLSFQVANDESLLQKLAENFTEVLEQQGIQLSSVEEFSLRETLTEKKTILAVEPWTIV